MQRGRQFVSIVGQVRAELNWSAGEFMDRAKRHRRDRDKRLSERKATGIETEFFDPTRIGFNG